MAASDVAEKRKELAKKVIQKAEFAGERMTENCISIILLMAENPYITKKEIGEALELHYSSVSRNIEAIRNKYIRRVGSDRGGFWEIIE